MLQKRLDLRPAVTRRNRGLEPPAALLLFLFVLDILILHLMTRPEK